MKRVEYSEFQAAMDTINRYKEQVQQDYELKMKEVNDFLEEIPEPIKLTPDSQLWDVASRIPRIILDNGKELGITKTGWDIKICDLEGVSLTKIKGLRGMGNLLMSKLIEAITITGVKLTK